jgi:hypothetical protein
VTKTRAIYFLPSVFLVTPFSASGTRWQPLLNQSQGSDFAAEGCGLRNQDDPFACELAAANQVRVCPILCGGNFDVIDYFAAAERGSSDVCDKFS